MATAEPMELSEAGLLDLKAQFDDVDPNHSTVIDVGVVQSLVHLALKSVMLEDALAESQAALHDASWG